MISVIIPTLDEQGVIGQEVAALLAQSTPCEIIVVDGGSRDATPAIVRSFGPPVHFLAQDPSGPPGRAAAYNQAARCARGDILLFLHADTRLPANG